MLIDRAASRHPPGYSREAESEADRFSVELMAKTGHDPAAISDFFEAMEKELGDTGDASILSTHPGTKDRKEAVEAYARELATQ